MSRPDARPPWKRRNPKARTGASIQLTPEEKAEARARAHAAGRRYPNLVDNMAVARKRLEREDTAARRDEDRSPTQSDAGPRAMTFPVLDLPRSRGATTLRTLNRGDVHAFAAYRGDPQLAAFQGWEPMTHAQAQAFVDTCCGVTHLVPGEWVQLAIAGTGSDELLGDVGLYLAADRSHGEIGFTLARRHQGQGHATRAALMAVELIFADPLVREVRAVADAANLASLAVLRRAAFTHDGTRDVVFKGQPCTEWLFRRRRGPA